MNHGILTPPTQYATMPRDLLGRPTPAPLIDSRVGLNPLALGGVVAWYDVSVASSRFQNSNGTLAAISQNDPVGFLADLSGSGNHLKQTVNNGRPLLQLRSQNGLPSLLFDGANDWLISDTAFTNGMRASHFAVCQMQSTVRDTQYAAFAMNSGRGGGVGDVPHAITLRNVFVTPSNAVSAGTPSRRNGSEFRLLNQIPTPFIIASGAVAGRVNVQTPADGFSIGAGRDSVGVQGGSQGNVFCLHGRIGELVVFNRPLSLQEMYLVESYLGSKWGVTLQ